MYEEARFSSGSHNWDGIDGRLLPYFGQTSRFTNTKALMDVQLRLTSTV